MNIYGATTPALSEEELARERRALSDAERRKLRHDVYGITDEEDTIQETPILIGTSLKLLDEAIDNLPEEEKSSYLLAKESVPELVQQESPPLAFLRCESFDVWAAAKRLCGYWTVRMRFFGPERAFLPMTLDGAMREDFDDFVEYPCFYQVDDDSHGRVVFSWDRRLASCLKRDVVLRCVFYGLTKASCQPEVSIKGYVGLGNYQTCNFRKDYDRTLTKQVAEMSYAMGAKVKAFHICTGPGRSVAGLLLPVIKTLFGSYFRLRLLVHSGSGSDVLPYFEDYGLNEKHIQVIYGPPSQKLALAQSWILRQQQEERQCLTFRQEEVENAQLW